MLNAAQINTFHMVASCCLANFASTVADLERICDPKYKCAERKLQFVSALLDQICGYVPDGEEILPYANLTGHGSADAGDTIRIAVNGVFIMNTYTFTGVDNVDIAALILAISSYGSGYTLTIETGNNLPSSYLATLTAPIGSGSDDSDLIVTAVTTGFTFHTIALSNGIDAVENNCIDADDMEAIIRKIASELNICSPLESLPETTLLTNPCGCC